MKINARVIIDKAAFITSSLGLAVLLIWFGIFKFTPTEAEGIKILVNNSPLMSWMYGVFSLKTTSQITGIIEIAAGTGIVLGLFAPKAGIIGAGLSALIFFTTSTFLISTGGMFEKVDGMLIPSGFGSFILKDIAALGASLYVLSSAIKGIKLWN